MVFIDKKNEAHFLKCGYCTFSILDSNEIKSLLDIYNGTLYVIPFSHKIFSNYLRPSPKYPVPFNRILTLLKKIAKPIQLKAGECICFDNKTVHGSFANTSQSKRLVAVATIYPQ